MHYTLYSGIADDIKERIENGLLDIAFLTEPVDISKYGFVRLPHKEEWGVLIRKDSPLAEKQAVMPQDLLGIPLLMPKRDLVKNELASWFGSLNDRMDFAVNYTMLMNAAVMVHSGFGAALCLNMDTDFYGDLRFVPLAPPLATGCVLAWKKSQRQAPAVEEFISSAHSYVLGISGN